MQTSSSADPMTYHAPRLRVLGFVHDLTQGGISVAKSDGVLFQGAGGGTRLINGSS